MLRRITCSVPAGVSCDSGAARLVIGPTASPVSPAASVVLTHYRGARRISQQRFSQAQSTATTSLLPAISAMRAAKGEVALEIPASRCLTRSFDIPREAAHSLPTLLAAEISRRTPFPPADVVHGHALAPVNGAPTKLTVTHVILRRDLASAEAGRHGLSLTDFDALIPVDESGAPAGPELRITTSPHPSRWPGRLALALLVTAIALAAAALVTTLDRLDTERARIESAISVASAKAKAVRSQVDGASAESALLAGLTAEKADQPALMEVWEELSRLLPDGTWITEVLLSEDRPGERLLTISGYSGGPTALVAALSHSALFTATALTAAITPDAAEGKDRFALQTRLIKANAKTKAGP